MTPCYLGLGSNLNSPKRHIHLAFQALRALPQTQILNISSLYQSKAAGVVGQPNYCNAVALLETRLPAHRLLKHCLRIEKIHGRVRKKHWGARTLDLDLLLYGHDTIQTPDLTLPHPRLHLRDFMLTPLLELWPDANLPDGTSLTTCLDNLEKHDLTLRNIKKSPVYPQL
jgi:2-amino-4-hydroxy-6-hydroxymethyldihydropteridine diphosphokinase